jgi:hypothetical protein
VGRTPLDISLTTFRYRSTLMSGTKPIINQQDMEKVVVCPTTFFGSLKCIHGSSFQVGEVYPGKAVTEPRVAFDAGRLPVFFDGLTGSHSWGVQSRSCGDHVSLCK